MVNLFFSYGGFHLVSFSHGRNKRNRYILWQQKISIEEYFQIENASPEKPDTIKARYVRYAWRKAATCKKFQGAFFCFFANKLKEKKCQPLNNGSCIHIQSRTLLPIQIFLLFAANLKL